MRLSSKQINQNIIDGSNSIPSDFNKPEVDATIRDKGYKSLIEKAYMCPCKDKGSTHKSTCRNCGGTGWIFCNPTRTSFIITGIQHDSKLKEASFYENSMIDLGIVNVTATEDIKLSYMDRITLIDATAEHSQILYVAENSNSENFTYTKYDIKSIDYIAAYVSEDDKLLPLNEGVDYVFQDNVIRFISSLVDINAHITIRYVHNPVFHVIDIMREAFTSYSANQRIDLPIKVIAKRAHLILDVENFDGDRLFDNSWLPNACGLQELSTFHKMIKYGNPIEIYNMMTNDQRDRLNEFLEAS